MIDPPDTPLTPSQQIRHSRRFDIDEAYDKLHADLAAANARIAELEASVKRISSTRFRELDQSRERIVALEAERDGNSHYQLIVAAMSILEDIDCVPENPGILEGIESMRDRIVFLEDAARQVTPIAPESLIEQSKLIAAEAKIKELEETIWNYSDDCAFMDRAREKIAALEAERNAIWVKMDRMRDALVELVACKDAAGPGAFPGAGYRWHDAWSAAQAALAEEEKP